MPFAVDLGFQPFAADALVLAGCAVKPPKRRGPCEGGFGICGPTDVRDMDGNISSAVVGAGVGPPKRGAPERCGIGVAEGTIVVLTAPFAGAGGAMCSHDMLMLISVALPLPFAPGPTLPDKSMLRP